MKETKRIYFDILFYLNFLDSLYEHKVACIHPPAISAMKLSIDNANWDIKMISENLNKLFAV